MVKRIRTLLTLFLLVMGTGLSWADVTKCTWDFTDSSCPAGNAAIEKGKGTVASDVAGVELYVDATAGKFNSIKRSKDVQINATTIIHIPVKTNKDEITIYNYPDGSNGIEFTIGDETATRANATFKYVATDADVKDGHATMTVTGSGYANGIVVKQHGAASAISQPERIATWDWKNGVPSSIASETKYEGNAGDVNSDVEGLALEVDATTGKFKYNSLGYVQFNVSTVVNVPVRSAGDVVTIVSYSGQFSYTIGGIKATGNTTVYKATEADAEVGYVSVVAVEKNAYLYSISVRQIAITSETPSTGEKERTATWDWQNGIPTTIASETKYEGNVGDVNSDVEGLALEVDATTGKFKYNSSGYVQFNVSTVVNVPVRSAGDIVTIVSYQGQYHYTIGGVKATGDVMPYKATEADAEAGYVSVVAVETNAYLYSISVLQIATGSEASENPDLIEVAAGNASDLLQAIEKANKTGYKTIYLPNGVYDLGTTINTEIKANNIAIIGESRDGVIIKNAPTEEGLDKSATLKNTSTGLYLQDVTIQCYAPYNSSEKTERGVALWDKGTKTICKNVYLKGKQDTYYSNGAKGMIAYFEGGKIEGAVDFICGSGSVLFNSVTLNVVDGTNSGNVIAAPSTYKSENGYVFANCKITGASSKEKNYYLARGWQNSPAALFVHTNFDVNPNTSYWGHNINTLESRRFAAYGTGASNDSDTTPMDKASLKNFAGDWDPAAIISQHKPIKTNGAGWASYTAFTDVVINGTDVKAYVARKINAKTVTLESIDGNKIPAGTPVFIYGADNSKYYVNGVVAGSVSGKNHLKPVLFDTTLKSGSNAFVIGTRDGVCGLYSVNSNILVPAGKCYLDATGYSLVLAKDGLEIEILDAETTGIGNVGVEADDDATRYNLAGQKVGKDYKGIVVRKDGKKYLAK